MGALRFHSTSCYINRSLVGPIDVICTEKNGEIPEESEESEEDDEMTL